MSDPAGKWWWPVTLQHPLLAVALWYLAGILLADALPLPLAGLFALALGLSAAALLRPSVRTWLIPPLLLLAGAANQTRHTAVLSPHDLRRLLGAQAELVAVRGTLVETPYQRWYAQEETETARTLAVLRVDAWRKQGREWEPASGRVAVTTPGTLPAGFVGGQGVELTGVLRPPNGPLADGLFDYAAYLRRQGIYFQLQTSGAADWQALAPARPPLADRFSAWARRVLALGLPVEDEPLRLLWAMTLGWKTALTGEVSEPFMRSGTMHVFAISGLHIAFIAGIFVKLLVVARVPRGWCGWIVIPLLWTYTGVTGWQASAIRSTIMMTVIIAGWSLNRPSDLLNSLAAAAVIILVWDPRQLFQASFQLSFSVVLSLALFAPVLERLRQRLLQPDPLLPESLRPRWQAWVRQPLHFASASFVISLAAWLGSLPLIAFYFHLFTPVSLLANLVVVPLSSAALACNLASLLVGGWCPFLAELFNHSAWFWMLAMTRVSEWAAACPGGALHVAAPGWLAFGFYYALLLSVMTGWLFRAPTRGWLAGGLAILAAAWLVQWQVARHATRLTVLPLNGGHAAYLEGPVAGGAWLVDCGNASAVQFVTKPFLQARGVNRLPHLALTHGDARHVGGCEALRESFHLARIHLSPVRFRSPVYRRLQETLAREPGCLAGVQSGEAAGPWTVLHPPPADRFSQADDSALVLLGSFGGTRVLLLSDLGKPGQNALLSRQPGLRADIVVTGLPQQGEPVADAFLETLQAQCLIVADAEYPATDRASPRLRARLARQRFPVLYTRDTGAVTLSFAGDGWELRTMNGLRLTGPIPKPDAEVTSAASTAPPRDAPAE